jgi:hypothetical protein
VGEACDGLTELLQDRLLKGADPRLLGQELAALIGAARRKTPVDRLIDTYLLYPFLLSLHRSVLSRIHNYFLTADHDPDPDQVLDPSCLPTEADYPEHLD